MGKSFRQMFSAFTTAFVAIEVLMQAVLHLCTWAEATAGAFEDEAKLEREAKASASKLAMLGTPDVPAIAAPVTAP